MPILKRFTHLVLFLVWCCFILVALVVGLTWWLMSGSSKIIYWAEHCSFSQYVVDGKQNRSSTLDPDFIKSLKQRKKAFATIHTLPIEELAKYVDPVCKSIYNNKELLEESLGSVDPSNLSQYKSWNATSVGNMAYICLHGPEPYATNARALLDGFIWWREQFEVVTTNEK